MVEEQPHEIKMRDRAIPNANDFRSSIAEPEVTVENFEIRPSLIQMVQQAQFGGSPMENPNVHIQRFLHICNTMKMHGVPSDIIRLQLFPFSLRDKAIEWLMSMPPGHFTTWNDLSGAFLAKYFPPSRTAKIRHELATFTQRDGETLYEAWERNKDLQRQCPHHRIPEWLVIENFYNGLDQTVRSALDAAAGGSLMGKSEVEARDLIEEMALHNYQYGNPRGRPRGMLGTEAIQMLTAKLDQISHKVDSMQVNQVSTSHMSCGACGMMGHQTSECLLSDRGSPVEEVHAFNSCVPGNPYPYNSNLKNPAKFPMSNVVSKSRTEELLEQFIANQQKKEMESEQKFQQLFSKLDQMEAHNRILETQVAQLSAGTSQWNHGKLPSQPEPNPRGVNAITLRSGRLLETHEPEIDRGTEHQFEPSMPKVSGGKLVDEIESLENVHKEKVYVPPPPYQPPLPFPQRIQKAKLEKQYGRFLSNLQKLSINVPFLEALSQMPSYAKFLKELLSNKRNLEEVETVASTTVSSSGVQHKLPQKLQDPGSFSIPCFIGNFEVRKALCDLGASVSLIPLSICKKLDMGDLKPTSMTLQMADRSIKHPVGIIEDIPLKVGKFFIPVDFVVLDITEDNQTPIILGRPFLATAGAMIDMTNGKLTFRIGDETVEFKVFPTSKSLTTTNSCFQIDVIDRLEEKEPEEFTKEDNFSQFISWHEEKDVPIFNNLGKPTLSCKSPFWLFLDKFKFSGIGRLKASNANQWNTKQKLCREMDPRTIQPP